MGTWSPLWSRWEEVSTPLEDLREVKLTFAEGLCDVRGKTLIRPGTYPPIRRRPPKTVNACFTESDVPELIGDHLRQIYEVKAGRFALAIYE